MVVRIRLARWGAANNPFYGLVAANLRAARDGKHLERLGTFNPIPDAAGVKHLELKVDRIKYWLSVGAQPSERAAWLLSKADLMPPTPHHLHREGIVAMNDRTTWDVAVKGDDGRVMATMPVSKALSEFEELQDQLPVMRHLNKPKISSQTINLDGRKPVEPLSETEALAVLREYLHLQ